MGNTIDWALTGQATVYTILVCVVLFLWLAFIGWVGRRMAEIGEQYPPALPHNPMKYEGRDLTPEQRRAVIASDSRWTENEYQQNARRAESLGFMDQDDEPRRSA